MRNPKHFNLNVPLNSDDYDQLLFRCNVRILSNWALFSISITSLLSESTINDNLNRITINCRVLKYRLLFRN